MKRLLLLPFLLLLPLSVQAQSIQVGPEVEPGIVVDVRDGDDVFMTHSEDLTIESSGVACQGGGTPPTYTTENNYWRVFDLADFGVQGNLEITTIMHTVGNNTATNQQMYFLYELNGPLAWDNLDILDVHIFEITPDDVGETFFLDLDNPVTMPAGSTLALQLHIPHSEENYFAFSGFNELGQTAPTYIHSGDCDINDPTDLTDIGFGHLHWIVAVMGKDVTLDGEGTATTRSIALGAAFPNPSTGMTTLPITLEEDTHVRITIHDVLGRQVGLAFDNVMQAGEQTVNVDTGTLASGTYVVRMAAGTEVLSNRIMVVR